MRTHGKRSKATKLARLGHFPPASQAGRLAGPVFFVYVFSLDTTVLYLDGVESEDGEEEGVGTDKVLSKLVKGGKRMEQIKVKKCPESTVNHYRRVFFVCRLRKRSAFYLSVESLDSSTSTVKF
jgi:hypothetical protein